MTRNQILRLALLFMFFFTTFTIAKQFINVDIKTAIVTMIIVLSADKLYDYLRSKLK